MNALVSPESTFVWPPNYYAAIDRRAKMLVMLSSASPDIVAAAKQHYANDPCDFIETWCDTFDPRNAGVKGKLARMPFILFPRQRDFVEFLRACLAADSNGLVEKSRDMGATWLCVCFSIWLFLFYPGVSVGWGSRKAALVDRIGVMDSIFEKIRTVLRGLPPLLLPSDFSEDSMSQMKVYSQVTGSSISGEAGDDIGRGGRTRIYFKDESAHYEHPEAIEAALGDNTRVQIDISSVNGLGNVFHRKREAGVEWQPGKECESGRTNVFVMDWSDHPDKDVAWYAKREADARENGLEHIFRQEVDRDYAASVEGVVCPAEWVRSAIDAHVVLGLHHDPLAEEAVGGFDVADSEAGDKNALAVRISIVLEHLDEWYDRDTAVTARRAIAGVEPYCPINLNYDSIGVGAGVKAEANRLADDRLMPRGLQLVSWEAGAAVLDPEKHVEPTDKQTPLNKDFFTNLKAQAWWSFRRRLEKTHRAVQAALGKGEPLTRQYHKDELVSISSKIPHLRTLQKELSQPTMSKGTRLKMVIDKAPEGTKSPNLADSVIMCYFPMPVMFTVSSGMLDRARVRGRSVSTGGPSGGTYSAALMARARQGRRQ